MTALKSGHTQRTQQAPVGWAIAPGELSSEVSPFSLCVFSLSRTQQCLFKCLGDGVGEGGEAHFGDGACLVYLAEFAFLEQDFLDSNLSSSLINGVTLYKGQVYRTLFPPLKLWQ